MESSPSWETTLAEFVHPGVKRRYKELLASEKGRKKLVKQRFAHSLSHELDPRYATPVPAASDTLDGIERLLRDRGAPATCRALSELSELDGRELPLREALGLTLGRGMGTVLVCVPGALAYVEGEDAGQRWICAKPAR
jgi:hypothetical protein